MTNTNEIQMQYFGILKATINHQNQHVVLILKRYAQPVSNSQVKSMVNWALRSLGEKYPYYKIALEVNYDV